MTSKIQKGKLVELKHQPSHMTIITDAPKDNQGEGSSFSPTDLLAGSLISCASTILAIRCQKLGVELVSCAAQVNKHMTDNPRRVARLDCEFKIKIDPSATATLESLKPELEKAIRECPVAMSLHPSIEKKIAITWDQ